MNHFEQELRRVLGRCASMDEQEYTGRVCYGRLNDSVVVKAEFVTLGHADQYEAIRVSLVNRREGQIDSNTLRFGDLLGKKRVSNPNFSEGIVPYIRLNSQGNPEWYVYKPTAEDYGRIAEAVDGYLGMFQEPGMEQRQADSPRQPGMRQY